MNTGLPLHCFIAGAALFGYSAYPQFISEFISEADLNFFQEFQQRFAHLLIFRPVKIVMSF